MCGSSNAPGSNLTRGTGAAAARFAGGECTYCEGEAEGGDDAESDVDALGDANRRLAAIEPPFFMSNSLTSAGVARRLGVEASWSDLTTSISFFGVLGVAEGSIGAFTAPRAAGRLCDGTGVL